MKPLIVILLLVAVAHADAPPWARGVPEADQREANRLFAEANDLFARQADRPALAKYRAAVALWDHPMIRFNLAVTLIRLDQVLEAADNLDSALRFGDAPFTKELYQQALDDQRLLRERIGTIEVICSQPDTRIAIDGRPWPSRDGKRSLRTNTGEHTVVAERAGYLTRSQRIIVGGGTTTAVQMDLIPLEATVKVEYPYARWVPWTVTGIGIAIAAGGFAARVDSEREMDQFRREFAQTCPRGCELSQQARLVAMEDHAKAENRLALSMLGVGGVAVVTGIVLQIANRPHRVARFEVTPTASGINGTVAWLF